ncbi:MAG: phosphotransferase [Candidatus Promineifilaceae bacterium]|nr:phosphotransferase [Candidatus Promineifilaceae bacterium]
MDSKIEPTVQRSGRIPLSEMEESVLQSMFDDYHRIAIEKEFGAGYSACRVLRVRPIGADGAAHRPELVKIGPIGLISEEWQAYDSLVRTTLPRIAWVTSPPKLDPVSSWGGMRYELVGAGIFEVQSLNQYYEQASTEDFVWVLQKRLFRVLSRSWWLANRVESAFQFRTDYDHLLPVNLLISANEPLPDAAVQFVTPLRHPMAKIGIGTRVCLRGFMVVEVESGQGGLTLNHPRALADRPFDSFRVRIQGDFDPDRFKAGVMAEPLYGVVTATRHSQLRDLCRQTLGEYVNLEAKSFKLPGAIRVLNPLLAYRDLLSTFHEVNLSTIHGDLNLENVLVDPETRDVKLIDFASVRIGHNLHDLIRLETGLLTSMLPKAFGEAKLPTRTIVTLYQQLDKDVFRPERAHAGQPVPDALKKSYAVLTAIRQEARKCLFNPEDPSEYYTGLILYLLGALKFKSLDAIPEAKPIAFLGAAAAVSLLEPPPIAAKGVPAETTTAPGANPVKTAIAAGTPSASSERVPWRRVGLLLAGLFAVVAVLVYLAMQNGAQSDSDPAAISALCQIEEAHTANIIEGPARGPDLLSYFEIGNPELFEHIRAMEQIYLDGQAHRGITYVWGAPGVGKSLITREPLGRQFAADSCEVEIKELFSVDSEKLSFPTARRPALTTLDGQIEFDSLPGAAAITEFELDNLLDAAGCREDGQLVPLIIFDDLDEVTEETSTEILRSLDRCVLDIETSAEDYIHIFVFGRPEGFAPWFQDPRRNTAITRWLRESSLGGPYVETKGDVTVLADDEFRFLLGEETWETMKADGRADALIEDYVAYVEEQPILSYSVRSLVIALMIADRVLNDALPTSETTLKAALFEALHQRAVDTHGRPSGVDDPYLYAQYLHVLEEIAVKYNDEALLDEEGFFSVGPNDTVPVTDGEGNEVGQVAVRDVLDHSGIAYLKPASFSAPVYSFYPIWIHSHLVELHNQRLIPNHQYRTCGE